MNEILKKKKYKYLLASFLSIIFILSALSIIYFTSLKAFKNSIKSKDKSKIENLANKQNKILSTTLNNNFTSILEEELQSLNEEYKNKTLSEIQYINLLSSYKSLNLCNDIIDKSLNNLPLIKISEEKFKSAMTYFNNKDFESAIDLFEEVNENSPLFKDAEKYMNSAFKEITTATFNETENLIKNTNYTDAINLLKESKEKVNSEEASLIEKKISQIEDLRMKHLYDYSAKAIEANTNNAAKLKPYFGKLNKDNINEFDIESKTNKLVFTDIQKQKTYIFKGSNKNWTLEKEFLCSTGVDNKETLVGYFEVTTKAPWFFSPKYGQGGKNYVQFKGNYLYHSIPLDSTQTKVLDYTLGEPASHGCIRLAIEDSKWLYDNINEGSTVLIF